MEKVFGCFPEALVWNRSEPGNSIGNAPFFGDSHSASVKFFSLLTANLDCDDGSPSACPHWIRSDFARARSPVLPLILGTQTEGLRRTVPPVLASSAPMGIGTFDDILYKVTVSYSPANAI